MTQARNPRGRPRLDPRDRTIELALSVPSKLYAQTKAVAQANRVSVSDLIRHVLRRSLTPKQGRR